MSIAPTLDSKPLNELRSRFEEGLLMRLASLRAALSARPGRDDALALLRRFQAVAACFEAPAIELAAREIETALTDSSENFDNALELVDRWIARVATKPPESRLSPAGPRVAFVGQDERLADRLAQAVMEAGGVLSFSAALGDALELGRVAAVDGFVVQVSREMADTSFRVARNLRRTQPIAFLGDSSAERRANSVTPIRSPNQIQLVVDDLARQRETSRVVLVDDDKPSAEQLGKQLADEGIETFRESATAAIEALDRVAPDALVLETSLRGIGGIELCRRVRARGRGRDQPLPVLFVTADATDRTRLGAFEAGADDVLLKPVNGSELSARVRARIARYRTTREALERDPATLAWTRARAHRWLLETTGAGVILIRVDGLRAATLERGLAFGDLLLQATVRVTRSVTRSTDKIARWGTDEILVGLPRTHSVDDVAARIGQELAPTVIGEAGDQPVSLAIGWAEVPDHGTPESALKQAFQRCTRVPL